MSPDRAEALEMAGMLERVLPFFIAASAIRI